MDHPKLDLVVINADLDYFLNLIDREYTDFEEEIPEIVNELKQKLFYYRKIRYPIISLIELSEGFGTNEHTICEKFNEVCSEVKKDLVILFKKFNNYPNLKKEMSDNLIEHFNKDIPKEELDNHKKILEKVYLGYQHEIYMVDLQERIGSVIDDFYYLIGLYKRYKNDLPTIYSLNEKRSSNSHQFT